MGPQVLLPPGSGLVLEPVQLCGQMVQLIVRGDALGACCPSCACWSDAVHSRYQRTVADLPVADRQVIVHLRVRRFRCREQTCPRRTFVEQVPSLVQRYARRTQRLRGDLEEIGLALASMAARCLWPVSGSAVKSTTAAEAGTIFWSTTASLTPAGSMALAAR